MLQIQLLPSMHPLFYCFETFIGIDKTTIYLSYILYTTRVYYNSAHVSNVYFLENSTHVFVLYYFDPYHM